MCAQKGSLWNLVAAASISVVFSSIAAATPPTHNRLGATFKVLSKGETSTIEIRLAPKTSFDTVTIEAGSGVSSLTPPCSFSSVEPGGSYVCQVSVTYKAGAPSLTVNVVGQKTVNPAKPRIVEIGHFTLVHAGFVPPSKTQSSRPTPGLVLTPPSGAVR